MPCTWVICPVITTVEKDGTSRRPSIATLIDPGLPERKVEDEDGNIVTIRDGYSWSAAISDGAVGQKNDVALCYVCGVDLSALSAAPDVLSLLETVFERGGRRQFLDQRPQNRPQWNRISAWLQGAGIDTAGLSQRSTFREILARVGKTLMPGFNADDTAVR